MVVDTFPWSTISSPATFTTVVQRGSVPAAGQLLPAVAEVMVLARMWSPVPGFLTVTENVMVAAAPTARSPLQLRVGLAKVTVPAVADASAS